MGYNKVVLLLNDAEHEVTKDPAGWWERCREAFYALGMKRCDPQTFTKEPESFGYGCHANGWQAVWEAHADNMAVIIVGGNRATVIGTTSGTSDEIEILKEVLGRKGYSLRKKPSRKTA